MTRNRKIGEDAGDADALESYLRQLGGIEVPTQEAMHALSGDFEEAARRLRAAVDRFGFAAREMVKMLEDAAAGEEELTELFLPSSFPDHKVPPPLFFTGWRKEIARHIRKVEKLLAAGGSTVEARDDLSALLGRYGVQSGVAEEYVNIICGYIRMLVPDFEPSSAVPDARTLAAADPEKLELVSGKLLMSPEEMSGELSRLCQVSERYQTLRRRMVESNLRLVVSIARKFRNRGIPFSDLIQEGNLGLMRALERFDFRLGYKFSTYASWWIRHNILRIIAEQSRVIRLPMHMIKLIQDIRRHEQNFLQIHGREPDNGELARLMELPEARISAVRKMAMQTISLQTQVGNDEDGGVLEELIADETVYEPARELARRILYDRFREMLGTLPEREQQIIIMRFGLFGNKVQPLDEISRQLHLTRERVRQLEIKILATLRSPEKLKYIDGCIHPGGF